MNNLHHRASDILANWENAKTPFEKSVIHRDMLSVKADLEKQINDGNALAALKASNPQSAVGSWTGSPRFIFMVRANGPQAVAAVTLPDGRKVIPIQGQIPVPETLVEQMTALGWKRANDVTTPKSEGDQ